MRNITATDIEKISTATLDNLLDEQLINAHGVSHEAEIQENIKETIQNYLLKWMEL